MDFKTAFNKYGKSVTEFTEEVLELGRQQDPSFRLNEWTVRLLLKGRQRTKPKHWKVMEAILGPVEWYEGIHDLDCLKKLLTERPGLRARDIAEHFKLTGKDASNMLCKLTRLAKKGTLRREGVKYLASPIGEGTGGFRYFVN